MSSYPKGLKETVSRPRRKRFQGNQSVDESGEPLAKRDLLDASTSVQSVCCTKNNNYNKMNFMRR